MGVPPTSQKFAHSPPSPPNFYSLPTKSQCYPTKNKNDIFSCSHCSSTNFVLISCSFETQVMLMLISIDVQYSQNAVFCFEQFSNRQNYSSPGSHHLVKKFPQQCSLLFDTKSGKLPKFQVKKNRNFILKPRQ